MSRLGNVAEMKAGFYYWIFCLCLILAPAGIAVIACIASEAQGNTTVAVATPINTESAGRARELAFKSVLRVSKGILGWNRVCAQIW